MPRPRHGRYHAGDPRGACRPSRLSLLRHDYFDPSCAPGMCTPAWGGATACEGLMLLRALSGLRFVAFGVNTVSPPHDVAGKTAFLAAACVREFLLLAVSALGRNTRQV